MKTEKDKMLQGELYYAFEKKLLEERQSASNLLFQYNTMRPNLREERNALLRELLGSTGNEFLIEQPFHCDYGYNIHVGENFYANIGCTILDGAEVRFGDNVLLAPHVGIYTVGHPINVDRRIEGLEYAYPVSIGNNVWIGAGAIILPGITIGDNVVVGAGSVVTKNIANNMVAAGNPCKIIKENK